MKNVLKRFLTVMIICCMGICLAAPAYAAETGTVTETETYEKIADIIEKYDKEAIKLVSGALDEIGSILPDWVKTVWTNMCNIVHTLLTEFDQMLKAADPTAIIEKNGSKVGDAVPKEIANNGSLTWPMPGVDTYISNPYCDGTTGKAHNGVDICANGGTEGQNIAAAQNAIVLHVGVGVSEGRYVILDHGNGLFTLYYHCSSVLVKKGTVVRTGDVIATAGHTGFAVDPHLHFEVRIHDKNGVSRLDPMTKASMP